MSSDLVNHPSHYAEGWSNGAEVIDITENLNFNRGNAVKYIARAGKKDPAKEMEDLEKAEFYLKREILRLSANPTFGTLPESDRFFIDHISSPFQPRVWKSLTDVPNGVEVTDSDNDGTVWVSEGLDGLTDYDEYGPFTEVIGDE